MTHARVVKEYLGWMGGSTTHPSLIHRFFQSFAVMSSAHLILQGEKHQ
jgi:hypothetical protein